MFGRPAVLVHALHGTALRQGAAQLVQRDGLDEIVLHSRRQTPLAIAFHRFRRHRDDAGTLLRRPAGAYLAARLEAVHARHLDVHENHVVGILLDSRQRLPPVRRDVRGVSELLEEADGDVLIDGIVFGQQDP